MTQHQIIPALSDLKDQAQRLRQSLARQGIEITHSRSLELLAGQYGARDWNTLRARAAGSRGPMLPRVGGPVRGRYMGHPFTGRLKAMAQLAGQRAWRVSIQLDQPVDAVSFASFSALRHRVSGIVGQTGRSYRHRSDGTPHLEIDWSLA